MTYEMNRQLQADSALSLADYHVLNALVGTPDGTLSVTTLAAQIGWERSRAVPIDYRRPLSDAVPTPVDAVLDASGRSNLQDAVAVAGGPARVITLSDPHAAQFGVVLSGPVTAEIPRALQMVMDRVADGTLSLPGPTIAPLDHAADVHSRIENGTLRGKVLLQP
jgi:hypothetical protein